MYASVDVASHKTKIVIVVHDYFIPQSIFSVTEQASRIKQEKSTGHAILKWLHA